MSLTVPLGLAAAALALPLALWYLLRSRRPPVQVASTFLWERTDRAVAAAVPWQRFRPDRTFWFVLAALLLGALALARPSVPVTAALGDHTIVLLDVSASMQADEEGPSRLELARREAESLVADIGPGQTVSVIEAGPRGRVALSGSSDPTAIRRALRRISATQGTSDLADALTLAAALERPNQSTVLHLITDGDVPPEVAAIAPPSLQIHAVGTDRPNLAVTRLETVATGGGAAQAFVQVRNMGLVAAQARVRLAVDGVEALTRDLELGPRETTDLVLPLSVASGSAVVQARVSPTGPAPSGEPAVDALSLDDAAYATLSGPREVNALVVGSQPNVFLTSALAAVEGVDVATVTAVPETLDGVDLLILDRVPAPDRPTVVPTIFVRPSRTPPGVEPDGPEMELPSTTFQSSSHPLLTDVDLAGTAIASAQPVSAAVLETVVGAPGGPLVLAGRLDQAPVVYLTFDLLESNLPLQVAWPVLVANAVGWLTSPPAVAPLEVGEEARYAVPPAVQGIQVTPPTGDPILLDVARPRITADQVGLWSAAWTGDPEVVDVLPPPPAVAVNVPPSESDLVRDRPPPGGVTVSGGEPGEGTGQRVLGRELLAGVLALLALNWLLGLVVGRRRGRGRGGRRARPRPPSGPPPAQPETPAPQVATVPPPPPRAGPRMEGVR